MLTAAAADAAADHSLARTALLAALPFAAVDAIAACGDSVDRRPRGEAWLQAILASLVVALVVLSSALRSNAVQGVPHAAEVAVVVALTLMALRGALALLPRLRRLAGLWPAKP